MKPAFRWLLVRDPRRMVFLLPNGREITFLQAKRQPKPKKYLRNAAKAFLRSRQNSGQPYVNPITPENNPENIFAKWWARDFDETLSKYLSEEMHERLTKPSECGKRTSEQSGKSSF